MRRRVGPRPRSARNRTHIWERARAATTLKKLLDHGGETELSSEEVGGPDRPEWVDSFLAANRDGLDRLAITSGVRVKDGRALVLLTSSDRLGAIPLRSPITRKTMGGLLVEPRFGWLSIGQVLGEVGFRVEPEVGGLSLVPGSAREVPPWVLAGPVISRIAALINQMTRTFVPTKSQLEMPRGTVDWNWYAGRALPTGRWTSFLCSYSELCNDPELSAALRWTLRRVDRDLDVGADSLIARRLKERIGDLLRALGPGPVQRPGISSKLVSSIAPEYLKMAVEAMAWVRDERGLGGARTLDGLPWSLPVDRLWEAWVESFLSALALRLGSRLSTGRQGSTHRPFVWRTHIRSMGHVAPDFLLELPGRTVWIDAKYKGHLDRMAVQNWSGLPEAMKEAHRADLHQALAYALFSDAPQVDTFLVYPRALDPTEELAMSEPVFGLADLAAGERRVRLGLGSIPFGFDGPAHRERVISAWEKVLRAAA